MASEKLLQLPAAASADFTDVIYAVKGSSPSDVNSGTSEQETLQQVCDLSLAYTILHYGGNPNGHVAGKTYQLCFDYVNFVMYVCVHTGDATHAVWDATMSGAMTWSVITSVSVNAIRNNGYITNRSATPVSVVLPSIFAIGDEVEIMGLGAGGWSLVANAGQTIQFGSVMTSIAGAINSDIQYANIAVRGLVPNTTWTVVVTNSNPTYV